jgi:YHS domain-containing protein
MRTAAIVIVLVVPATAWAAQQQPGPQMAGVAQAAVTGCAQAHPMAERTIEMTNRRLEAARQANSPSAMRAAMDDLQAALRQLRTDIAPCAGLESLAPDPHAGHVMPAAPQAPAAPPPAPAAADADAVHAMTTAENPAARLADLTCQPHVDPDTAPRATYLGKAYYFCTAADRNLFLKAPAKYLQR